jgi:hypothetical protein
VSRKRARIKVRSEYKFERWQKLAEKLGERRKGDECTGTPSADAKRLRSVILPMNGFPIRPKPSLAYTTTASLDGLYGGGLLAPSCDLDREESPGFGIAPDLALRLLATPSCHVRSPFRPTRPRPDCSFGDHPNRAQIRSARCIGGSGVSTRRSNDVCITGRSSEGGKIATGLAIEVQEVRAVLNAWCELQKCSSWHLVPRGTNSFSQM